MLAHNQIWEAIDKLAKSNGYSASGLAKQAGLDATTFNKSKRFTSEGRERWPSTESIAKILAVTGVRFSDFTQLVSGNADEDYKGQTIPVLGFAKAGREGFFDDMGYPSGQGWDEVEFPMTVSPKQSDVYALEVSGDSMQPLYRAGDKLIIDPTASLKKGDRVIVKTLGGEVMAKELLRKSGKIVALRSLNMDHEDQTFNLNDLAWLARVVWVSQ